ncbi:MAG: ATP-binding cassette domain-containing protein [Christensenellaceae bacterium]|nr:ATP-binding cassette domain-containing protein [Christensenellaceae bacterium]
MPNKIIEVENLSKVFKISRTKKLRAVDNVSFYIKKGETLGIVGESGCGKTTLSRVIMGIYKPTEGRVIYEGNTIDYSSKNHMAEYSKKMQMIFQDPYASLNPRMTVSEIISEGWAYKRMYPKKVQQEKAIELLEVVGLNKEHANRFPHEFSGGQRQRIGIARALSMDPEVIICDEPISALDVSIQAQVMNLLFDLQKEKNLTYLFIAHDLSMIRYISTNIMVMYLGSEMEFGSSNAINNHPLHPYTEALFSANPVPDPDIEKNRQRIMLTGEIPSPINAPPGCKFSTRCKYAKDICKKEVPKLREIHEGHYCACHFPLDY